MYKFQRNRAAPVVAGVHEGRVPQRTLHKVVYDDPHDGARPLKLPAGPTQVQSLHYYVINRR